jgi:hypothetical protein
MVSVESATERYVSPTRHRPHGLRKVACTPYSLLAVPDPPVPAMVVTVASIAIFRNAKLCVDATYITPLLAMAMPPRR